MMESGAQRPQPPGFISMGEYHWPRIRRSLVLVLLGGPVLALGICLVANGLPEMSLDKARIAYSWGPLTLGAVVLVFGIFGLVSGIHGAMRTGDAGVIVRGGHMIPWGSIKGATLVRYMNQAKVRLLWSRNDMNRDLVLRLKEPLDVPGVVSKSGKHTVRIRLLRYPATEYKRPFAEDVTNLGSQSVQVVEAKKYKQT